MSFREYPPHPIYYKLTKWLGSFILGTLEPSWRLLQEAIQLLPLATSGNVINKNRHLEWKKTSNIWGIHGNCPLPETNSDCSDWNIATISNHGVFRISSQPAARDCDTGPKICLEYPHDRPGDSERGALGSRQASVQIKSLKWLHGLNHMVTWCYMMLHDVTCSNKGFKDLILRMSFFISICVYIYIYQLLYMKCQQKHRKRSRNRKFVPKNVCFSAGCSWSLNLRPKGGVNETERKQRFIWAWKHDGILMGTDCLEIWQNLSRWAWGGSSEKSLCWTQTCPSPCWSKSNSS